MKHTYLPTDELKKKIFSILSGENHPLAMRRLSVKCGYKKGTLTNELKYKAGTGYRALNQLEQDGKINFSKVNGSRTGQLYVSLNNAEVSNNPKLTLDEGVLESSLYNLLEAVKHEAERQLGQRDCGHKHVLEMQRIRIEELQTANGILQREITELKEHKEQSIVQKLFNFKKADE